MDGTILRNRAMPVGGREWIFADPSDPSSPAKYELQFKYDANSTSDGDEGVTIWYCCPSITYTGGRADCLLNQRCQP